MPGRRKRHRDPWRDFHRRVVLDVLQAVCSARCASASPYSGSACSCFAKLMLVGEAGILFLDAARIGQHEAAQVRGAGGAVDLPLESERAQPRQVADVIEMRVRQHHRIDGARRHGKRLPVAQPELLQSLEESAVDEHAPAAMFEQVFRARDRARRAEKGELSHAATISGVCYPVAMAAAFRLSACLCLVARRHSPSRSGPGAAARAHDRRHLRSREPRRFQRRAAPRTCGGSTRRTTCRCAAPAAASSGSRRRGIGTDVAAVRCVAHGRRACRAARHDAREGGGQRPIG